MLLLIVSGTSEITLDEIGEINDFIQSEAGHNANIIMGVGEDETLGEGVAVTIIATGFNVEQQAEIVNTEPKKIIHSLEDEQKIVHDLSAKAISNIIVNEPIIETKAETQEEIINPICDEKVIFTLEETEKEEIAFEIQEPSLPSMNLIPTTEFLKNIDVTFEVVAPDVVNNFEIITPQIREIEVVEPEFVKAKENEFNFSLNLFEDKKEENNQIVFDLTDEIKEMEVKEPVNFIPVTEVGQNGIIKYSLEDYLEKEKELTATAKVEEVKEPVDEELNFSFKNIATKNNDVQTSNLNETISPLDMSIEDSLRARAEERKRKMKDFNYKFNNSASRIDEIEKEPAYKRMGIDLTQQPASNNQSRMSLGTDSNDDVQLRSNNSFLHDNVD